MAWLGVVLGLAQDVGETSPAFGFASVSLRAASDTFVAVTFPRAAAFAGQVASAEGNVIVLAGAPGWTPGQWEYAAGTQRETYYVFFRSGAKEGHAYTVVASGDDTLTVALERDTLAGVVAGDRFKVVPHWTLGTLLPAAAAGSAFAETTDPAEPATTVFLTDPGTSGVNPAATGHYFYSGAWRQIGLDPGLDRNDVVIRPGVPFRVRNGAGAGTVVLAGTIVGERQAIILTTATNGPQDHPVALLRPLPVALGAAGLIESGAFAPSVDVARRGDLLLVSDNAAIRLGKPATEFYFYQNSGWRKLGRPLDEDFGAEAVFGPAKSVVIRKAPRSDAAPAAWTIPRS